MHKFDTSSYIAQSASSSGVSDDILSHQDDLLLLSQPTSPFSHLYPSNRPFLSTEHTNIDTRSSQDDYLTNSNQSIDHYITSVPTRAVERSFGASESGYMTGSTREMRMGVVLQSGEEGMRRSVDMSDQVRNLWQSIELRKSLTMSGKKAAKLSTKHKSDNDKYFDARMHEVQSQLDSRSEIDFTQLQMGPMLGEGAFGIVYRAELWGMDVAVKKIKESSNLFPIAELTNEIALLKTLRHPNCVLFLGFTRTPNFCIVTEFMPRGCLYDLLHNPLCRLSSQNIMKVASSVALGMNYLHTQFPPITHRDLKSANILVDDNWTIKVADYGISSFKKRMDNEFYSGTAAWQAPEVTDRVYLPESDVYSYGVLLWELISRKIPFEGVPTMEIVDRVKQGERPDISQLAKGTLQSLIQDCWRQDPKGRPSFSGITKRLSTKGSDFNLFSSEALPHCEVFRETDVEKSQQFYSMLFESPSPSISTDFTPGVFIGRYWSGMSIPSKEIEVNSILKKIPQKYQEFTSGVFSLKSNVGVFTLVYMYDSFEKFRKVDSMVSNIAENTSTLYKLSTAPLIREHVEITPYFFKNPTNMTDQNSMTTISITMTLREGADVEVKNILNSYMIPELSTIPSWCGTLAITNYSNNQLRLITLFTDAASAASLESYGFVQLLTSNFSAFLRGIPTVEKQSVLAANLVQTAVAVSGPIGQPNLFGDQEADVEEELGGGLLSSSGPVRLNASPEKAVDDRLLSHSDSLLEKSRRPKIRSILHNKLSSDTSPIHTPPKETVLHHPLEILPEAQNAKHHEDHAKHEENQNTKHAEKILEQAESMQASDLLEDGWEIIGTEADGKSNCDLAQKPDTTVLHSLQSGFLKLGLTYHPEKTNRLMSVLSRFSCESMKRSDSDQSVQQELAKFTLPPGEFIIQSYKCALGSTRAGVIYLTPSFVCFDTTFSLTPFRKKTDLKLALKDIVSINKTKYSFLPGNGHSVELYTKDGEIHIFKGLLQRDSFVQELCDQAKSLRPSHTIMTLSNGEILGLSS
eukprot:TRINITY_DN9327_c0_g1_i1.p1 TRINITY_DN9327_c0_g1~~TRINITY_DN9327_c0_g1_i1.p1  ORF type:complete len:1050 (-),score=229.93 TRINITY_DN9327_c0_g1_i1:59-3151(-)